MARGGAVWKGRITFGLIGIPVELVPAIDTREHVGFQRKESGEDVEAHVLEILQFLPPDSVDPVSYAHPYHAVRPAPVAAGGGGEDGGAPAEPEAGGKAEVVDLVSALRASLGARGAKKPARSRRTKAA